MRTRYTVQRLLLPVHTACCGDPCDVRLRQGQHARHLFECRVKLARLGHGDERRTMEDVER